MRTFPLSRAWCVLALVLSTACPGRAADQPPAVYNVRDYGATGDGKTLDTDAVNKAIDAASTAGGGTVLFPSGTYLCYSIRLKSDIELNLTRGATILAADQPSAGQPGYDPSEPNRWGDLAYQDSGHSHWHNSLIWGENLENISIVGTGRIWGRGLLRAGGERAGQGNKSIALKLCRNVNLKDFTIQQGGWFAVLVTGVDNLTISNLRVDTNRDGFDIDCCRNVRVSDCQVNSPQDDGIVLKSSYGLGYARSTDNVAISNCQVSGYVMGTVLDGTYQVPPSGGGTGRIKFGTESNGGFRNISISNCIFVHCNGLALESVDGAVIEDVTISNLAMEYISNPPIFIRLGARMRGPEGIAIGAIRRVNISNVVVAYAASRAASIISGIPGHPVEDVNLSNIRILYKGGDNVAAARRGGPPPGAAAPGAAPAGGAARGPGGRGAGGPRRADGRGTGLPPAPPDPFGVTENEDGYPEPTMFGTLPAYGLYVRHANRVTFDGVDLSTMAADSRPPIILYDVAGMTFRHTQVQAAAGVPAFKLNHVADFSTEKFAGVPDLQRDRVDEESIAGTGLPLPGSTYTAAAPAENVPDSANTPIPRGAPPGPDGPRATPPPAAP
jgi:polygalacturonase